MSEAFNTIPFDKPQPQVMCSWNECAAGHRWMLDLAVTKCPGCKAEIVAARLTMCPVCNEPPKGKVIRMDVVATGGWIGKECQGEKGKGESMVVELERMEVEDAD